MSEETSASSAAWYVLRTQVKKERAAAAHLKNLPGVEVFLPRLRYLKNTRRGKIWWVEPLFPGYLLAKFDHVELGRAVTHSQGVSKIVAFGNQLPEVPEHFVAALQEQVRENQTSDDEITIGWKVEAGQEVEIAEGPFKGLSGEVIEVRPSAERVSLLLEFLGETQSVEVSLHSLILVERDLPENLKD